MKKLISIILISVMILTLAACSTDSNSPSGGTSNHVNGTDSTNAPDVFSGDVTEEVVRNHRPAAENDFEYRTVDGGVEITAYTGTDVIVAIPETINGKPVVAIVVGVFGYGSTVRGVLVPSGVKELNGTFGTNTNLEVVIWESAEIVGANLFNSCTSLHTVSLGDHLVSLGENAFFSCTNLEELYISASLENIDSYIAPTVFFWCGKLTIKGETGSYIESFCMEYGIPFEAK